MKMTSHARAAKGPLGADGVYFLMWPDWDQELRSNRWHYARRWARLVPVILLQPVQQTASPSLVTQRELRIPNCRILHLQARGYSTSYLQETLVQLGQVTADADAHGIRRPLLWCYNATLVGLYAALPAVARVFHATENYFQFESVSHFFLECQRAAVKASDLTIAVSDGVAASLRENVPDARIEVVTNGCDYEEYSDSRPDERILAARTLGERVAVYAGNINNRLDFSLLERCVRENPKTIFAFFGPVAGLAQDDAARWGRLLSEPNVRYFGPAEADDLPGLYWAADLGIIPYKQTRLLVENGFPLKALEMCATGLPVVSTWMKPLDGLMEGLIVVRDYESFLQGIAKTSRSMLTNHQKEEMKRVCQLNDYEKKFAMVLASLTKEPASYRHVRTRLDELVSWLFEDDWKELGAREWRARTSQGSARWTRTWSAPRLVKGSLAVWLMLRDPSLWHLWLGWLRSGCPRGEVGARTLLGDLLRLSILRRAIANSWPDDVGFAVRMSYDQGKGLIVARSVRAGEAVDGECWSDGRWPTERDPVTEIVWDHSEIGTVVPCRVGSTRFWVFMGTDGRYEFRAVAAVARQHPEIVWAAIGPPWRRRG